jgi:hypothetical protein
VIQLSQPFPRQASLVRCLCEPDQLIVSHAGDSTPSPLSVAPIWLQLDNSDGIIWL